MKHNVDDISNFSFLDLNIFDERHLLVGVVLQELLKHAAEPIIEQRFSNFVTISKFQLSKLMIMSICKLVYHTVWHMPKHN